MVLAFVKVSWQLRFHFEVLRLVGCEHQMKREVIDDVNQNQAQNPNPIRQEPLSLTTTVEKLIGENFGVWKFQMSVMFCA